ncbi:hypothetical protein SEUCBS139899_002252 [Sporothrix eucalyptigena]|uniref:Cytochrome P450 n=1 Tax=Sporothrix eucalyptigena TaxID=1812306 RepID=A0ABP0CFM8_9PEZI
MALFTVPVVAGAVLVATVVWIVTRLRSADAAVPGPAFSLFSSLPLKFHEFCGNRTRYVHSLHLRYGSVVRLAPGEVAFASLPALKEIYMSNGSGYDKTAFYHLFRQYSTPTMFSTLDKQTHSKRRRILADRYANSNVVKAEALDGIRERASRFAAVAKTSQTLDIYIALHSYAFDGVTHHLFHPFGSNALQDEADERIMREVSFDNSLARRLLEYYYPSGLPGKVADLLGLLPPARSIPRAKQIVLDAVDATLLNASDEKTAGGPRAADFTLLARLQDPALGLTRMQMAAECMDHMAAGIETTGDVLCWLMWQISLPAFQGVQDRLFAELQANRDPSKYDSLPYLNAVLKEGLRMFPSIPMSLPRHVPEGGRVIDGTWLPGGTIVSCQPYTMHRFDQDVFPRPDEFEPDRWLDTTPEQDAEMNRRFFAFSNGGRGCLGKHLAMAEMKLLLRDVYMQFQTVLTDEAKAADMSMADQIISARPKDQTCKLKFIPRGKTEAA